MKENILTILSRNEIETDMLKADLVRASSK